MSRSRCSDTKGTPIDTCTVGDQAAWKRISRAVPRIAPLRFRHFQIRRAGLFVRPVSHLTRANRVGIKIETVDGISFLRGWLGHRFVCLIHAVNCQYFERLVAGLGIMDGACGDLVGFAGLELPRRLAFDLAQVPP